MTDRKGPRKITVGFSTRDADRPPASRSPFPAQAKPLWQRWEEQGRCPDCGRPRACYSCVTQGGWISEAEQRENEERIDPV